MDYCIPADIKDQDGGEVIQAHSGCFSGALAGQPIADDRLSVESNWTGRPGGSKRSHACVPCWREHMQQERIANVQPTVGTGSH